MEQHCYLCGSPGWSRRPGKVRDAPSLEALECDSCGLVYLSSREHLGKDHYRDSGMHGGESPDVDSWLKETSSDDERRFQLLREQITNRHVLDFGCGNGGFLERARECASVVAGVELEQALQPSFGARGLKVFNDLDEAIDGNVCWDLVTAFHVVEHLEDPRGALAKLSGLLVDGGELIVEVPSSDDALLTLYECEPFRNFTYWSHHLFLFNFATLSRLAMQSGLRVNWVRYVQRYPLSNHLYWLAKGLPGGHRQWHFLDSNELMNAYEARLASLGKTDTIIAGLSK